MKKIMLMAAAAGMLLAPAASQAVLVTNVYTNYNGVYTYATNKYEQPITVQGAVDFVEDTNFKNGKVVNKNVESGERFVRCSFSTKDILAAAGIPNGVGKLIRRQNRYTQTLTFSNCVVVTTLYDVSNGICFNFITNTIVTNVQSGTKCWVYGSTVDLDGEETIIAANNNNTIVKILNSSSNSAITSRVSFFFHQDEDIETDNYLKNGTGTTVGKALIHYGVDASGDVSNKLWKVEKSSFEFFSDYNYGCGSYTYRTIYNARDKCWETAPGSGSWTVACDDGFYHYFPYLCGPGTTSENGFFSVSVRVGPAVKKP